MAKAPLLCNDVERADQQLLGPIKPLVAQWNRLHAHVALCATITTWRSEELDGRVVEGWFMQGIFQPKAPNSNAIRGKARPAPGPIQQLPCAIEGRRSWWGICVRLRYEVEFMQSARRRQWTRVEDLLPESSSEVGRCLDECRQALCCLLPSSV
jgi:hypothetical protein